MVERHAACCQVAPVFDRPQRDFLAGERSLIEGQGKSQGQRVAAALEPTGQQTVQGRGDE